MSSSSSLSSVSSLSSSSQSSSLEAAASAPTRGIRLRRFAQTLYTDMSSGVQGYRFRVVAYGAYLMPVEIFRYLRRPLDPTTGSRADEFDGVCSPADLAEMPAGAPTDQPPFFRLAELDLVFRSRSEADDAWTVIQADTEALVRTLDLMDNLGEVDDVTYGSPPDATPPSS